MTNSTAELIQESVVERLWEEKGRQDGMKIHTRRSILKIIERVNGSKPSDEIKKQVEGIHELEILDAILDELWNVKEMEGIVATINKYDWLDAIKRFDEE